MDELDPNNYTIAWIAPLEIEAKAALAMLDHRHHGVFPVQRGDDYIYWAGDMRGHNVVIGTLPEGHEYGNAAAAALASQMKAFFRNVWLGLLVGVAAGLPKLAGEPKRDIRLGDVLVAVPDGDDTPGLVAYELGKDTADGFRLLRSGRALVRTEPIISSAIKHIKIEAPDDAALFLPFYQSMKNKDRFADPGQDRDTLFDFDDKGSPHKIRRAIRPGHERTRVWYGPIGSGDKLVKRTKTRNELRDKYNIIGLEMEAAGTINRIPVGVFRGVCDYGDERKNKEWQPYAAAMAAAYAKAILYRIRPKVAAQNDVRSMPERTGQLEACLRSLAFPDMDFRFHHIDQAKSGTCNWVLEHDVYVSWYSSRQGLLWINGKPGSGKSTALKYMLSHMKTIRPPDHKTIYLSFFFHGRGSELQKTLQGLFRSLLHQLLSQAPDACPQIVSEYSHKCKIIGKADFAWGWHTSELEEYFRMAILKALDTQKAILFVDALDESGKDTALRVVKYFKLLLQNLSHDFDSWLHICFSCRHYPILDRVSQFTIRFEDGNTADIEAYVQCKLLESQKLCEEGFVRLITEMARGMFLWAKLVSQQALEMDSYGHNSEAIKVHIHWVSSELEEIYGNILRGLENPRLSLRLFYWVAFSMRGLSPDELRWPMAIDMGGPPQPLRHYKASSDYVHDSDAMARKLVYLGRGLVEIASSDRPVVQFIHETARQYIIDIGFKVLSSSTGTPVANFGTNEMYAAHYTLAKTCLRYIAAEEVGDVDRSPELKRLPSKPHDNGSLFTFLGYAVEYWLDHARRGEKGDCCSDDLLNDFDWSAQRLLQHCNAIERDTLFQLWDSRSYQGYNLLHFLVHLDLPKALKITVERLAGNVNHREGKGRTPIALAAKRCRPECMKVLLHSGNANINCRDVDGRTPLALAAIGCNKAWGRSSCNGACIRLLLQAKGVDVNARDNRHVTALAEAAIQGNYDAVKELLATANVNVNLSCKKRYTPLHYAVWSLTPQAVTLLADCPRVDVNVRDINGTTPLMLAAWRPSLPTSVVQHLINSTRIDINARDNHGATALSEAARHNNGEITRLLLEAGVNNLASKDTTYQGPDTISDGINKSSLSAINQSRLVIVDSKDHDGRTPLLYAAKYNSVEVANLLLEAGADCKGFKIGSYFLRNGWKLERIRNQWVAVEAADLAELPIR